MKDIRGKTIRVARALFPTAGLAVLLAVWFAPFFFQGKVVWPANTWNRQPWDKYAPAYADSIPSFNPDFAVSYYPRRVFMKRALESGEFPLWNPYSFCGTPFIADIQAGVLYPVNWFLLPLDPARQFAPYLYFHMLIGGVGMFYLLRRHRISPDIAFAAAAVFSFNEYFLKYIGLPTFLATAAWIPWMLLVTDRMLMRPTLGAAVAAALVGTFSFLAGQPQTVIHGAYALLIYIAARIVTLRSVGGDSMGRPKAVAGAFLLAATLALLLCAAQLLPTAEIASQSARTSRSYEDVLSGSFHPVDILRAFVPDILGNTFQHDWWGGRFKLGNSFFARINLTGLFAGTAVLLTALWGMITPGVRRRALPFTLVGAFFALVAFGTPLTRFAWRFLPGFRFSRIDRASVFILLAVIALAAFAAEALRKRGGRGRIIVGCVMLLGLAGGLLFIFLAGDALPQYLQFFTSSDAPLKIRPERTEFVFQRTLLASLFGLAAPLAFFLSKLRIAALLPLALSFVQLFQFGLPYRAARDPQDVYGETTEIVALRELLDEGEEGGGRMIRFGKNVGVKSRYSGAIPTSTNIPFRIRDLQGYNALCTAALGRRLEGAFLEKVFSQGIWSGRRLVAPEWSRSLTNPIIDALSVRAVVSSTPIQGQDRRALMEDGWKGIALGGLTVWENTEALPRARLLPFGRGLSKKELRKTIQRGSWNPRVEAFWRGEGTVGDSAIAAGEVRVTDESLGQVTINCRAPAEQILVFADSKAPGWKATLDGEPVPLIDVYDLVRGLIVPEGEHTVRMWYSPASFRYGLVGTITGLIACTALLGIDAARRRRTAAGTDSP